VDEIFLVDNVKPSAVADRWLHNGASIVVSDNARKVLIHLRQGKYRLRTVNQQGIVLWSAPSLYFGVNRRVGTVRRSAAARELRYRTPSVSAVLSFFQTAPYQALREQGIEAIAGLHKAIMMPDNDPVIFVLFLHHMHVLLDAIDCDETRHQFGNHWTFALAASE
jgi:hypothetical protein